MTESLDELVEEPVTVTQALGLVAIVFSKAKVAPSDFFGFPDDVQKILDGCGTDVLQAMLRKHHSRWDGKEPLWAFLIREFKDDCTVRKAEAVDRVDRNHIADALKVLRYQRECGNLSLAVVEKAKATLNKAMSVYEEKPKELTAAEVLEPEVPR